MSSQVYTITLRGKPFSFVSKLSDPEVVAALKRRLGGRFGGMFAVTILQAWNTGSWTEAQRAAAHYTIWKAMNAKGGAK